MSTDNDWWSRRLGTPQQQQPQQQTPIYPQPQYPQQQAHPQSPQYNPHPAPQQQIRVTPENLYEAAMHWQGGEATRTETQSCPKCGGNHYYSRSGGVSRGPSPAPMCFDCGFNGMFTQGDPAVWQGA